MDRKIKCYLLVALCVSALGLSGSLYAEDSNHVTKSEKNLYGYLGVSVHTTACDQFLAGLDTDFNGYNARCKPFLPVLDIGLGYKINKTLSIEGQYDLALSKGDFEVVGNSRTTGDPLYGKAGISYKAIAIGIRYVDRTGYVLRVGMRNWAYDYTNASDANYLLAPTDSLKGTDPYFGLGWTEGDVEFMTTAYKQDKSIVYAATMKVNF